MNNKIFISYSRRDLAFVKKLHHALKTHGLKAWFDQTDIPPGNQWRETIVRAINTCKIFLLVLSPAAVKSKHVQKELDLAEIHHKLIVPVVWEHTPIPPGMKYQLVGIQYFDFDRNDSPEKFSQLAQALHTVLNSPRGKSQHLSTWKPRATDAADKYGRLVIARVVTPLAMNIVAQDKINADLHWLFSAAEHFIHIRRGVVSAEAPVPVPIPAGAKKHPRANNRLMPGIDDFSLRLAESRLVSLFKQLNIYLQNLTFELERETQRGGTVESNIILQNSIKAQRQIIVERIRRIARIVRDLYGVQISGADTLANYLDALPK